MAFTPTTFLPLSSMANSDAVRMFSYETVDATAVVVAADYFNPASAITGGLGLQDGDVILCKQPKHQYISLW